MINVTEFQKIKKTIESAQSNADKAKGALEQIQKVIAEKFSCGNIQAAQELFEEETKAVAELEQQYEEELAAIKNEFPQLFGA